MMPVFEVLSLVLLGAVVWFWLDGMKVRDIAVIEAREACDLENLQFLDDTVATAKIRFVRDDDGRLVLQRVYAFEYSDTGNNRRPGSIVMRGQTVLFVNVGLRLATAASVPH